MKKITASVLSVVMFMSPMAWAGNAHYELLRGSKSEYDPGAAKNSSWQKLYASAPNYRQVGKVVLGGNDEKFRWEMGPMWYRGRLGKNQVKVFVVGQEGAQDENVSNRAFTGSTGTKTQAFLNHIGIFRSYLFMNTFVYTINGQLDGTNPKFAFLEQGTGASNVEASPIVQYRHQLFDNMLLENEESIALFMGVGSGGKNSLATWINARGGKCSVKNDMENCDTSGMVTLFNDGFKRTDGQNIKFSQKRQIKIFVVGVPHPGGASQANGGAGALANIIRGFTKAAQRVANFKKSNHNWLEFDTNDDLDVNGQPIRENDRLELMQADFKYNDAGVPYRDFAFGTNSQMGENGTTSNRWKADSIQVFSGLGVYGDKSAKYNEAILGNKKYSTIESAGMAAIGFKMGVDLPWEPPRVNSPAGNEYDAGPCGDVMKANSCRLADLMTKWDKSLYAEAQSASFGPISMYRGNTKNPKLIVLADQTSHDDFFSGRALTGEMGQKLQTVLNEKGLKGQYVIVRTSPFDTLENDATGTHNVKLLKNPAVVSRVKEIVAELKKAGATEIVSLGDNAAELAKSIDSKAKALDGEVKAKNISAIPRSDLPYHSRWWMGTSGNRAIRGVGGALKSKGAADGKYHYYRIYAPDWNSKYAVPALDKATLDQITKGMGRLGDQ